MVTARSTAGLRHSVCRHLLAVGTRIPPAMSPGDVATRIGANAADAGRVGVELVRAAVNLLAALGGTVALGLIDPWLCVTFLAGAPVVLVAVRAFAREASEVAGRYLETQGMLAGRLVNAVSGARSIAAAGTFDREVRRVLTSLPDLHRHGLGLWRVHGRIASQEALIVPLLQLAVLGVGGVLLVRGRLTAGEMLAATQYVVLASTFGSSVTSLARLARARAAADRALGILAQPSIRYGTAALPSGSGRIEFRGVTARVGGRPILDGVDLTIPGGMLVALVGRTGSGKSLLAAVVGRLVDPDEGEVLLDGVPVRDLERRQLRQAVTYGFERPALIGESLSGAIAFGNNVADERAVVAAAVVSRADDFIRRMPQGYATPPSEAPMSGGERQRIGLARVFAHQTRIILLDDVAASLDTMTEHHITQVLTGQLSATTRLVVAHRASTAARADLVVWLDQGRVREVAPHGLLWGRSDYRSVFKGGTVSERVATGAPPLALASGDESAR
jgi:ATP-binding cassette subfamily B protein